MNCIIIDDIKTERIKLNILLGQIYNITVVEEFDCPIKAYQYLSNNHVDFIILDLDMPTLHGLDFLYRYKGRIPSSIVCSSETESKDRALELGAKAFIDKPSSLDDLQFAIEDIRIEKNQSVA